jgi:hypothetical protein
MTRANIWYPMNPPEHAPSHRRGADTKSRSPHSAILLFLAMNACAGAPDGAAGEPTHRTQEDLRTTGSTVSTTAALPTSQGSPTQLGEGAPQALTSAAAPIGRGVDPGAPSDRASAWRPELPFFSAWTPVSAGLVAVPGTPVTAAAWGEWPFALFATGADSGIYTAAPNPDEGLPAPWAKLPGLAAPGTPVTAVPWPNWGFALFVTGTDGGIYTAAGDPQRNLAGDWARLGGLVASPGTPVTAVPWGSWGFALFAVGADGGIYTAAGDPQRGLAGPWAQLPGAAAPGSQVTALPWGNWGFALFVVGTDGGIYTAAGDPQSGLPGPWAQMPGGAVPGSQVTALPWGNWGFALFVTGTDGGIYTAAGDPQRGLLGPWARLSGLTARPGSQVSAVGMPSAAPSAFALYVAGADGVPYHTVGDPQQGFLPWFPVASTTLDGQLGGPTIPPGATISAASWEFPINSNGVNYGADQRIALFVTGTDRKVYTTASCCGAPRPPTDLHVTDNTTGQSISLAWTDNSDDNPAGFRINYTGKLHGSSDDKGTVSLGQSARTATLTGLMTGYTYTIQLVAVSSYYGDSRPVTVNATTPTVPVQVTVSLQNQHLSNPNGPVAVAYAGQFPPFGSAVPGKLLKITVPGSSTVGNYGVLALNFVKRGGSTDDCLSSDASKYVTVQAGQSTTAAQMTAIYGTATPPYSTSAPVGFLACLVSSQGAPIPSSVQIQATIVSPAQ